MIRSLVVEKCQVDRRRTEELLAVQHATKLGIEIVQTSTRAVASRAVDAGTLCIGAVPFVRAAVGAAGARLPRHDPYPPALRDVLQREVGYNSRLRDLLGARAFPVFVKPADGWKRFTGLVLDAPDSARRNRISVHQPVWWSQPVVWIGEWRAYCAFGEVLDLQPAPGAGRGDRVVDLEVVARAAAALHAAGGAAGVVLDFGLLESGETALVEANDGFAFGAYGQVTAQTLWKVWAARWPELIRPLSVSRGDRTTPHQSL